MREVWSAGTAICVSVVVGIVHSGVDAGSTVDIRKDTNGTESGSTLPGFRCRCMPSQPCWQGVPWHKLNASVSGRLVESVDELANCISDIKAPACVQALAQTDDEFWLTAQPNGYLHTGLYGTWNISTALSAYAVTAESEKDMVATVSFAAEHNLRLVVKGTGHDWYGRSAAAGSLLLWTHLLKNITWKDSFIPDGAPPSDGPVPAVTVGAGVQFMDLYPAANAKSYPGDPDGRKTIVMGGTCDSVGVGGCWLAGCYGTFTKKFGNGAVNLLEARVIFANGSVATVNQYTHTDVFWTLRGGGGANTAVVVHFTARVHPAPRWFRSGSYTITTNSSTMFASAVAAVMRAAADAVTDHAASCGDGGIGFGFQPELGYSVGLSCNGYEANATAQDSLFTTLKSYVSSHKGDGVLGSHSSSNWNQSQYNPKKPSFPWMERHPDREISTELIGSMTKYFPIRGIRTEAGPHSLTSIVDGVVRVTDIISKMNMTMSNYVMFAKAQSGMSDDVVRRFNETSQNPVLLDALGLWLLYANVPSLPQLPPSSTVLKALWPRLQMYSVLSKADPLFAPCEAGASGDEDQAHECFRLWNARVPQLLGLVDQIRDVLWEVFPNSGGDGRPFSGSYWNEADYWDKDFSASFWGAAYPRLLALKRQYDSNGLFYGHHAVGSELWTSDGNCPLE